MSRKITYGSADDQFFVLHEPTIVHGREKKPLMILIHGGYWKQQYNLNNALCDGLIGFFQEKGYYVSQLEYRRGNRGIDQGQGGWPETNIDLVLAFQRLYDLSQGEVADLDVDQTIIIGHSAGGTLALWPCMAGTDQVVEKFLGQKALAFTPRLCVAIAPIGSLLDGYTAR